MENQNFLALETFICKWFIPLYTTAGYPIFNGVGFFVRGPFWFNFASNQEFWPTIGFAFLGVFKLLISTHTTFCVSLSLVGYILLYIFRNSYLLSTVKRKYVNRNIENEIFCENFYRMNLIN